MSVLRGSEFDVRLLADEPDQSLTPPHPSQDRPYAWEEPPAQINEFLRRLWSCRWIN